MWLSSVWFDEVDFLKCSRSASQLSFTNLFSRLDNIHLLKVLGSLLTELHLIRGFQKYITLGVFREIRMKLLFRLGKANLLERLQNLLT